MSTGYEYSGDLFGGLDLSKKATGKQADGAEKAPAPAKQQVQPVAKPSPVRKPKRPERAPWADRMPNADADYIIPDEALYPDDDTGPDR